MMAYFGYFYKLNKSKMMIVFCFAGSTLATHKSSYHGEYSFGQTLSSDTSDTHVTRADTQDDIHRDTDDMSSIIKPAGDSDVKSWSSAGSSDMLF